jgi:rRNA maturation endonuclease Nob1
LRIIINKVAKGGRVSDFRGIPSAACPACGSNLIQITASFNYETYEIDMYLLDNAECAECGSLLTAPTPLDARV